MAWARWIAGARAEYNGERLWDLDGAFPDLTSAYCRSTCGKSRCDKCMQPRLLPDAEPAVAAYMAVSTQWRTDGYRTGLDYTACIASLKLHLPRWRRASRAWAGRTLADVMADLQIIESAILTADGERRDEERTPTP